MYTFAFENILEVHSGIYHFRKLVVDGFCLFDEFTNEVASNPQYSSELATLLSYMNFMAKENQKLPSAKFNHIIERGNVIGHEFKSKHLRIYIIKAKPDVIIVLGGYKNAQKSDIRKFSSLVKQLKNVEL